MAIPDYQTFMKPLLGLARDQQEHYKNRIGWARTYLSDATQCIIAYE